MQDLTTAPPSNMGRETPGPLRRLIDRKESR